MTFVMAGLDVHDRLILLVGGGDVTARRARRFLAEGAVIRIVSPRLSRNTAAVLHEVAEHSGDDPEHHRLTWVPRCVRENDVNDAWLVHTATGVTSVDDAVRAACDSRRIWCVNASVATAGSARLSAEARRGDLVIGTASTGAPDPRRSARVRSAIQNLLDNGDLPTQRKRRSKVSSTQAPETVTLIGGGPGPGDLVTVRGLRKLSEADVIVHDRLSPVDVLSGLAPHVEIIDVGKSPGNHPVPQHRINQVLIDRARSGLRVVRLKGGDPFVFGRGGEEVQACASAGIPVEFVPGISSAVAAPQVAGVPVTHRGVADSVHVVNGHRVPRPATLAALNDRETTVVVLMGISMLPRFADASLASGVPADRPVAIMENAHRPGQRCLHSTLGEVTEKARSLSISNPAVIVVGEVARPGLLHSADGPAGLPGFTARVEETSA